MLGLLAAEGGAVTPTTMETMLGVMNKVLTFSMSVFGIVLKDPILSFILAGSLVTVGITVLRQVKGVASA